MTEQEKRDREVKESEIRHALTGLKTQMESVERTAKAGHEQTIGLLQTIKERVEQIAKRAGTT